MNLDDLMKKIGGNGNDELPKPSHHDIVSASIRSSILSGVLFHNRMGRHFLARNFRDYYPAKELMNHPTIVAIVDGLFAEMETLNHSTDFCIKWLKKLDECTDETVRLLIDGMKEIEWDHMLAHPAGLVIIGLVLYDDRKFGSKEQPTPIDSLLSFSEILFEAIQIGTQRQLVVRNISGQYLLEAGFLDCLDLKRIMKDESFSRIVEWIRKQMSQHDRARTFATLFLTRMHIESSNAIDELMQNVKEAEQLFELPHPIGLALVGLYLYDHPNL